jgi:hypothetical protein
MLWKLQVVGAAAAVGVSNVGMATEECLIENPAI